MSTPTPIKPGTYRLTRDVANPTADKRHTRDWTKASTWPAGSTYLVEEQSFPLDGERMAKYMKIKFVGARYGTITEGSPAFAALVEAFEPIAETAAALMKRLDVAVTNTAAFCKWLVDTDRVTPQAFEELFTTWIEEDPDQPSPRVVAPLIGASAAGTSIGVFDSPTRVNELLDRIDGEPITCRRCKRIARRSRG